MPINHPPQWLYNRAIRLFGKERLEQWKDRIAKYWEKQLEQIDEDQLLNALTRLYGRREGKKLLRISRSELTQRIITQEEIYLVGRFAQKLQAFARDESDRFSTTGLKLEEHDYSTATHEGNTYTVDVDGLICITGNVKITHKDGAQSSITIFSRWLAHPFWQYAQSSLSCPA